MVDLAFKLENEFERVAGDPQRSILAKRRDLARLIRQMFDEAANGLKQGAERAEMHGDLVLDYFLRADLGPATLEDAFAGAGGRENLNYAELLHIALAGVEKLQSLMPDIKYRF